MLCLSMFTKIIVNEADVKPCVIFYRIHPEAERILGSSCIAVVCLERLTFQIDPNESVFLVNRQPLLSMVTPRTPQLHTEQQGVVIQEEHSQKVQTLIMVKISTKVI